MDLPKFDFLNKQYIIIVGIVIIVIILAYLFMCYYNKDSIIGGNSNINNNDSIIKDIENLNNKAKLTLYYADWCGYCKKMKPKWYNIKEKLNNQIINGIIIEMNEINGDDNNEQIEELNIEGYPTIVMFKNNNSKQFDNSQFSYDTLIEFIKNN